MRKLILAVLGVLLMAVGSHAQGTPYQLDPPAPNAILRACSFPVTGGNPCSNPTTIYSDSALTQVIAQPVQLGDSGNLIFYYSSGPLMLQLTGAVNRSILVAGGGGGTPGGGSAAIFNFSTSCAGLSNCFKGTADNSTDNCGATLTAWLAAVNSYSGGGIPQVWIAGGQSNAYKFSTCNLAFTNSVGVHVHSWATIDCAQSSGNCIQLGQSGLVAYQRSLFTFDGWGTLIGGATLTTAGIECESFIGWCQVSQTYFINFGPTNAIGGSCTGYAVQFDSPVAESDFHDNWWESTTGGQCAVNNTDSTAGGGQNTGRIYGNHIAGQSITNCGSVAIVEGGSHSSIHDNSIWGFDIPVRIQNVSGGTETGTMVSDNSFDNAGCTAHSVSAAINFGGIGSNSALGPITIDHNNVPGGASHETYFMALAGDTGGSASIDNVTFANNVSDVNAINFAPATLTCTGFCYFAFNQNINPQTSAGWYQPANYILAQKYGLIMVPTTVAGLPSAATAGAGTMIPVSDASTFTVGTCTGGGSDYMIAVSNGTSWSCH